MYGGAGVARMSVLERQQAQLNGQQYMAAPPPQNVYFGSTDQQDYYSTPPPANHLHAMFMNDQNHGVSVSPENSGPCFGFGGGELGTLAGCGLNYGVSRTASCPPAAAAALAEAISGKRKEAVVPEKPSSKKRKPEKAVAEDHSKDSKRKRSISDEEKKITDKNNNSKSEKSETSKVSELPKTDYIHVRARRGQATDSHSLAERVRREKISERMKYLQDIVPGCNKITGKAGMLDEIINYVQSLQRQVEFLSMKLAVVNPRHELDIHNMFSKEAYPAGTSEHHTIEESSEMHDPSNYHFASLEQVFSSCGTETDKNQPDMAALRRSMSAPVSLPGAPIEPPYFNVISPYPAWDAELQSLYALEFQQGGRSSPSLLLQTGVDGSRNVKMEM